MAQFDFYGEPKDWQTILGAVLSVGRLEILPNDNFPSRRIPRFSRVSPELLGHVATVNKQLYITGDFTTLPIRLFKLDGGEYKGTYTVDAGTGGPLITLSLPSLVDHDGIPTLIPGDLFLNARFGYDNKPGYFKPSSAAKEAYTQIKGALMRCLRRTVIAEKRVKIGPEALDTFQQGRAQILINGKYYRELAVTPKH